MQDRLSPALIIETKRANITATGEFSGYASTFGGDPDSHGDIILPGAFTRALATHAARDTAPALLWVHDHKTPIGKWLSFEQDSTGLLVKGKLTLATRQAADAYALMKDGAVSLSIGYAVAPGGASRAGGIRTIRDIAILDEISLLPIPSNKNARVIEVKRPETPREFERLLRDVAGFSAREAKRATAGGWRGFVRDERHADLDLVLRKIEELQTVIESNKS